ncbi:MAG: NAD(P)H-dependent oxidoreductase, partial [Lachnospiraceae bacterium]|nr:NAD(P)H-dependent oxidoreductase [Lachnospiraceae bacterium]
GTREWVQKEDMAALLEKMVHADVIVLATPVYFYAMSGQLKTMIDRTLPRYREIANKEFYFIATAAAGKRLMERTVDGLRGFTDCLPGAKVKGILYGEGVYQKGEVTGTKAMQEAYQMGKNI